MKKEKENEFFFPSTFFIILLFIPFSGIFEFNYLGEFITKALDLK